MGDYGRPIEFGISVVPTAADLLQTRTTVSLADTLGLDLVGIQDHPYQWRFLDTWALMADLLARTTRIRIFPDLPRCRQLADARAGHDRERSGVAGCPLRRPL